MTDAFWIILTGTLIAAGGGLLGTFLLLRRMAMVGDAIAHAVLPGIVIAFLVAGSRESVVVVPAAAATGVLTTLLIEWLHTRLRVQSDASTGIVFTGLFALGVVLISVFADSVDLDQDCVLYGEIAFVPLDIVTLGGRWEMPRSPLVIGLLLVPIVAIVLRGFKGFQVTSFDPAFASAAGIRSGLWHYALMAMVSVMTVAAFEAVGAVLVVAFLVVPAATAVLLSQRLKHILLLSVIIGFAASAGGYALAVSFDVSVAGSMAVASGILFFLTLLVLSVRRRSKKPLLFNSRIG